VLSTKAMPASAGRPISARELRRALTGSLRRLRTDFVDVYLLHGVTNDDYDHCVEELLPALQAFRSEGLVRLVGLSERFPEDPAHAMLERAIPDAHWDVIMVGFNLLNQSARRRVLPLATRHGIGVLCMFAVRKALAGPEHLRPLVARLAAEGRLGEQGLDPDDPLGFLVREGHASSLVDAAYRFCRHEPGCHVVLTGTGSRAHLEDNVRSLGRGPLPDEDVERLRRLFAGVDDVTGQET